MVVVVSCSVLQMVLIRYYYIEWMVVICKLVFLPIGRNSYAEYIITVNGLIFIIISTYICKKNKN